MINYALSDTLTLSQIEEGRTGTATLSTLYWQNNDNNIRAGYVILGPSGVGRAILLTSPGPMDKVVSVKIKESFSTSIFLSGNWTLNTSDHINVSRFLPPNTDGTYVLPDYFNILSDLDYGLREAYDAIDRVGYLRRWDKVDAEYLSEDAKLLGFFYALGEFSSEQKRRLIQLLPYFYQVSGTKKTIDLLSYMVGIPFVVNALWSSDYITFHEYDGTGYPTNHIQLIYNPTITNLDEELITGLFYDLCPIEWVLDSIAATEASSTDVSISSNTSVIIITHAST